MKKLLARKSPSQKRSQQMVQDILTASIRILVNHGGKHFTTIRVAEAAGISVGSLYQYFPNKDSILFTLQEKEWKETMLMMENILDDEKLKPKLKMNKLILDFFKTEMQEANLRRALEETNIDFEKSKVYKEHMAEIRLEISQLITHINPQITTLPFHLDLVITTMRTIGEEISLRVQSEKEIEIWAKKVASMILHSLMEKRSK